MEEQEKLEAELLDVGVADQLPETPREEPAAAVAKPAQGNLLKGIDNCSGAAWYSCNTITTTWIQISRQNLNGFFSNIRHQIMI